MKRLPCAITNTTATMKNTKKAGRVRKLGLLLPNTQNAFTHRASEDGIQQARDRNQQAVPSKDLPFRWRGLPMQQATGGGGQQADRIQINQFHGSKRGPRRRLRKRRARVSPEVADGFVEWCVERGMRRREHDHVASRVQM